jgi:hypothetical protein
MTAIVRASKELKGSTSVIRQHLDAVDRAREVYLGQIKRAEAEYFERIKKATEIVTGSQSPDPVTETAPVQAEAEPAA